MKPRHSHGGEEQHRHGRDAHHDPHADHDHPATDDGASRLKDPVCGMVIEEADSVGTVEHNGVTHYFCAESCLERFKQNPDEFLAPVPPAPPETAPAGAVYTCPMHPEMCGDAPGSCPICGMALEPAWRRPTRPDPELADMTRRFWIGLALAVPVVVLEMGGHLAGLTRGHRQPSSNWLQLVLATPVVLWAGWPFFVRGWASARHAQPRTCSR